MNVTSEVNTFLYIIDPRSTQAYHEVWYYDDESETSSYPSLANDDHYNEDGEYVFDSRLKKVFEAGIPYLVIVSAYNPSSAESIGNFYVNFK